MPRLLDTEWDETTSVYHTIGGKYITTIKTKDMTKELAEELLEALGLKGANSVLAVNLDVTPERVRLTTVIHVTKD